MTTNVQKVDPVRVGIYNTFNRK